MSCVHITLSPLRDSQPPKVRSHHHAVTSDIYSDCHQILFVALVGTCLGAGCVLKLVHICVRWCVRVRESVYILS